MNLIDVQQYHKRIVDKKHAFKRNYA